MEFLGFSAGEGIVGRFCSICKGMFLYQCFLQLEECSDDLAQLQSLSQWRTGICRYNGLGMLPMASSRAQKGRVYPGWTRGRVVVDSGLGYLDIADLQGSCPRACRVGALSIACCGAGREFSWAGLRCKDSTQAYTNGLRTGMIQENVRTSSCRWDRHSIITLAR